MGRRTTSRDIERMCKLKSDGFSLAKIGETLGFHKETVRIHLVMMDRGYSRVLDFRNVMARRNGRKSHKDYLDDFLKENGYSSWKDYLNVFLQDLGYGSRRDYDKDLEDGRKKRLENKVMSYFIKTRLRELGKTQSWLAMCMGVSRMAVSYWTRGGNIPSEDRFKMLCDVLEAPYNTLQDLVEDYSRRNAVEELL